MKRLGTGLVWAVGGYLVAAFAGYFLVAQFSGNTHDRELEAAMTSAFVLGPLGAVVAFIAGFIRGGRGSGGADGKA